MAYVRLAKRRETVELARYISATALAAQAEGKYIKAEIDRMLEYDRTESDGDGSEKKLAFLKAMLGKAKTPETRARLEKRIEELNAASH